jgi:5-methylcytosine-specific restriction protein A
MNVSKRTNPKWIRDEELLLVDLYLASRDKIPGSKDPKVIELSRLLARLPWHSMSSRASTFRNPVGIALKLQNLKSIDTGHGMRNTAAIDRQILYEFVARQDELSEMVASIRKGIGLAKSLEITYADLRQDFVFAEGKLLTAIHSRRERDPRLRENLLRERQKDNRCSCDLCGASFKTVDPIHRMAAFEVHHLLPLRASFLSRQITFQDVALLCAVCHRLIHSAIAKQGRWLDIAQTKDIFVQP